MSDLHPRTADLVDRFAAAVKEKLAAAQRKYGYSDGWADPGWMDECRAKLIEHVHKGDPRDVAAYCAFLWHHRERTAGVPGVAPERIEQLARAYGQACHEAKSKEAMDAALRALLDACGVLAPHNDQPKEPK